MEVWRRGGSGKRSSFFRGRKKSHDKNSSPSPLSFFRLFSIASLSLRQQASTHERPLPALPWPDGTQVRVVRLASTFVFQENALPCVRTERKKGIDEKELAANEDDEKQNLILSIPLPKQKHNSTGPALAARQQQLAGQPRPRSGRCLEEEARA